MYEVTITITKIFMNEHIDLHNKKLILSCLKLTPTPLTNMRLVGRISEMCQYRGNLLRIAVSQQLV